MTVLSNVAPAQTTPNAPARAGGQQKTTSDQERIPADHYDPDDLKTYEDVVNEDRSVSIRGHELVIHLYRPRTRGAAVPAIYACGDGGWRGLAPRTAQQLAHFGFAVAGLDSKVYLRELSSPQDPLTTARLATDYTEIARALRPYANVDATTPVYVYGWSLGAGFAVAVGSDVPTRPNWAGIIAIGLPAQNQLVSGLGANHVNLTISTNARYGFRTEAVMPGLSPVPLVMIQSTSDTASPPKVGKVLFTAARDPKQYVLIKAENHRFSGARSEFYSALANAMTWIQQARGNAILVTARDGRR
jgi:dienelactone hydrolase